MYAACRVTFEMLGKEVYFSLHMYTSSEGTDRIRLSNVSMLKFEMYNIWFINFVKINGKQLCMFDVS